MKYALYSLLVICLAGCSPSREVKERVASADGAACAIIAEVQTDATVQTPYEVYVAGACDDLKGEPVWRADKVEGLSVAWESPRLLKITAETSRVFLENSEMTVKNKGENIRIEIMYDIKTRH